MDGTTKYVAQFLKCPMAVNKQVENNMLFMNDGLCMKRRHYYKMWVKFTSPSSLDQ
jgi:hypothetical protein